jgi:hypothetical protein
MIYFWNVNALFELTSLIDRCYLDLVIKNTLENRIGGFVDSLNRQRKDSVRSKNWRSRGLICETPCKGIYVLFDT